MDLSTYVSNTSDMKQFDKPFVLNDHAVILTLFHNKHPKKCANLNRIVEADDTRVASALNFRLNSIVCKLGQVKLVNVNNTPGWRRYVVS